MQDRVPTKPNRALVRPEDGSPAFYATITRADEPTQAGDPLNKATFLKDETATLFGLNNSAVPDDMFVAIFSLFENINDELDTVPRTKTQVGSYEGTGTSGSIAKGTTLTFDFEPKLVVVYLPPASTDGGVSNAPLFMIYGHNGVRGLVLGDVGGVMTSWGENSVSWYANSAQNQCNESGNTYAYFAVGVGAGL